MPKSPPAASPDAYVKALAGWRRDCVETLRTAVRSAATLDETVRGGQLVYLARGPVLLIRAEAERVLLGFWRGQRLRLIEPKLVPGGPFEMATLEIRKGMAVDAFTARRLAAKAVALNKTLGDPTKATKPA